MATLRVLFISNEDSHIGGSSLSLLSMLRSLDGSVEPVLLFMSEGAVSSFFRAKGYNCIVAPFYRNSFSAAGLGRAVRFIPHAVARFFVQRRCVRQVLRAAGRVDIVHSNSSTVDIGLLIARSMGVPHVWHLREYYDIGINGRPFPSWASWKRKLFESDAVIAITPGLFDHWGLGGHRHAWCIPDAVCSSADAGPITPRRDRRILFVAGTISAVKRPDEALKIFAASGLPDYSLCFVGSVSGQVRHSLESMASDLGVADRITFIPFVNDIKPLLQEAAAVLVCTLNEGMGRVAVEAMFAGCPVIARNSGGSKDVLLGGELGSLYDSPAEGAALLREAVSSYPAEKMGKARASAISAYSTKDYKEKILGVYRTLLS